MATGDLTGAVPVYEQLIERAPGLRFPLPSLARAQALLGNWAAVDELLEVAATREVTGFEDGFAFVRAKRDGSQVDDWRRRLEDDVQRTGRADIHRLVYAAHLGLTDEAFRIAEHARLGPLGGSDDMMGPDGYRTSILFQVNLPELRDDPRFIRLCARLGLVQFWTAADCWPDCADEVPYDFRAECERYRAWKSDVFAV
jgi:hypothetical protein